MSVASSIISKVDNKVVMRFAWHKFKRDETIFARSQQVAVQGRQNMLHQPFGILSASFSSKSDMNHDYNIDSHSLYPKHIGSKSSGISNKIHAIPFSLTPQHAIKRFDEWRTRNGVWMFYNFKSIGATLLPYWTFDFVLKFDNNSSSKYLLFQEAYDRNDNQKYLNRKNINASSSYYFLPGISSYAGYDHKIYAPCLDIVHGTSLFFDKSAKSESEELRGEGILQELLPWMLEDLPTEDSNGLPVFPDAWNMTRGMALDLALKNLMSSSFFTTENQEWQDDKIDNTEKPSSLTFATAKAVTSKRVYLPTFVIYYDLLGIEFKAFVSGWDIDAGVSGIVHAAEIDRLLGIGESLSEKVRQYCKICGRHSLFRSSLMDKQSLMYTNRSLLYQRCIGKSKRFDPALASYTNDIQTRDADVSVLLEKCNKRDEKNYVQKDKYNRAQQFFNKNKNSILKVFVENDQSVGVSNRDILYADSSASELWMRELDFQEQKGNIMYNIHREQEWYNEQMNTWHINQRHEIRQTLKADSIYKKAYKVDEINGEFSYEMPTKAISEAEILTPQQLLGINGREPSTYSTQQLSQCFRRQALLHHPDLQPFASNHEIMLGRQNIKRCIQAYRVLRGQDLL